MNVYDEFAKLIILRQMETAAQRLKEYCLEHKNCKTCGFYNGTCRLNDLPMNWDMKGVSDGQELGENKQTERDQAF